MIKWFLSKKHKCFEEYKELDFDILKHINFIIKMDMHSVTPLAYYQIKSLYDGMENGRVDK